ncbi:hypothetical protein [Chryseobacterium sp. PMSZPI]|uniref:hypothetical protein n=1 Tax=Chryseobacterium sp. PMSZPI TaxID=1033900 RepID=UPI000C34F919|nr:hypothetical protein [Chryseobacterium sp. PMSZPI]PKF74851.1 hypothetical protein CW752_07040 [Chryseobacterium sp. PMSZPI]
MKYNSFIAGMALAMIPTTIYSQARNAIFSKTEKVTVLDGRKISKQILSEEEKKQPLAKYFYMPMAPVDKAKTNAIKKGPLDPAKALSIFTKTGIFAF